LEKESDFYRYIDIWKIWQAVDKNGKMISNYFSSLCGDSEVLGGVDIFNSNSILELNILDIIDHT
jgi:hypothetical protein